MKQTTIVLAHRNFGNPEETLDDIADEMLVFIASFRYHNNTNPITIISDDSKLFQKISNWLEKSRFIVENNCDKNILFKQVDFEPFYNKYPLHESFTKYRKETFIKIFLRDIIDGDFIYFDSDILITGFLGNTRRFDIVPRHITAPFNNSNRTEFISSGMICWSEYVNKPSFVFSAPFDINNAIDVSLRDMCGMRIHDEFFLTRLYHEGLVMIPESDGSDNVTDFYTPHDFFSDRRRLPVSFLDANYTNIDTLMYHFNAGMKLRGVRVENCELFIDYKMHFLTNFFYSITKRNIQFLIANNVYMVCLAKELLYIVKNEMDKKEEINEVIYKLIN